jgi:magnesium transporter
MVYTYKHRDITWIDLESPSRKEVRELIEKYNIDPLVADELMSPTARSRVDLHPDFIYLILHFPKRIVDHNYEKQLKKESIEVDFIIGRNFIITTRYGAIDAILEFSKIFESDSILDKSNIGEHAGYVFYYMIRNIYKSMYLEIENMRDKISDYEDKVFAGKEKEMVLSLSKMDRLLLYFKESLSFHKEILSSFEEAGKKIFEPEFTYYLRAVLGEYFKVQNTLESARDYLSELRETNDSLLSSKQNEVMKVLTILAFVTFPLTLIAGIFGMNTVNMPLIGSENDFAIIMGMMLGLAGLMFLWFKNKKWL